MTVKAGPASAAPADDLWGERARDWAQFQEPQYLPLYDAVFDAAGVGAGVRLVDAGCGCGLALDRAADRGADVAGFDASPALLALAAERLPGAELRTGTVEKPPFEAGGFDVVTMFNVAHHPPRVVELVSHLVPLGRPGALVAVSTFGPPELCDVRQILVGLGPWMNRSGCDDPRPPGPPGTVDGLLREGGFAVVDADDLSCPFRYADPETALRGVLAAAPFVSASRRLGEAFVRQTVAARLEAYRRADGTFRLDNVFRWVLARAR
jgi:SAM-dependent methyltransferase